MLVVVECAWGCHDWSMYGNERMKLGKAGMMSSPSVRWDYVINRSIHRNGAFIIGEVYVFSWANYSITHYSIWNEDDHQYTNTWCVNLRAYWARNMIAIERRCFISTVVRPAELSKWSCVSRFCRTKNSRSERTQFVPARNRCSSDTLT